MPEVYGFDGNDAERVARAVRRLEREPRGDRPVPAARPAGGGFDEGWTQWVTVTSETTTDGRYPGKWSSYDATVDPSSSDPWAEQDDCWVAPGPNDEALAADARYLCRLQGMTDDAVPIFVPTLGGGSGYTGTVTIVSNVECSGSTLTVSFRDLTYSNGLLTSVGAEY